MLSRITHFHLKTNFISSRSHSRQCRKRDSVSSTKHKRRSFLERRNWSSHDEIFSWKWFWCRSGGKVELTSIQSYPRASLFCWNGKSAGNLLSKLIETFSVFAGWRGLNRKIETATVSYAPASKSASHRNDLSPVITIGLRIDVEAHSTRHGESRPGHCATDQYRFVISIVACWDLGGFERNRSTLRFNLLSRFQKIEIDRSTKRRKGDCGHLRDFITSDIKLLFCVTANNERRKLRTSVARPRTNTSEHANMHDG